MGPSKRRLHLSNIAKQRKESERNEVEQLLRAANNQDQVNQVPQQAALILPPQEDLIFPPEDILPTQEDTDYSFLGFAAACRTPSAGYKASVGDENPAEVSIATNIFYGGGARSKVRVSDGSRAGTSGIRAPARQVDTDDSSDDSEVESEVEAEDFADSEEDTTSTRTVRGSSIRKREELLRKCERFRLSRKRQTCDSADGNAILSMKVIKDLAKMVTCPNCDNTDLHLEVTSMGLDSVIELTCGVCDHTLYKKVPHTLPNSTINATTAGIVASAMSTGIGYAGVRRIVDNSNLNARLAPNAYLKYQTEVGNAMKDMCIDQRETVKECVRNHYTELGRHPDPDTNILDVDVSYDGSWQTRGFQSNIGTGFVIEAETGFVLDYEVLSKFCMKCKRIRHKYKGNEDHVRTKIQEHKDSGECSITHDGTSGSMETKCAENIWGRSEEVNAMHYTCFISDGDSSAYNAVNDLDPYEGK
jgi:hypothetical protein